MHDKRIMNTAIGTILFIAVLACQTSDKLVAQIQPTDTPTRTPRPTLTPLPQFTDTLIPSLTPTAAPTSSSTPTRRPPTARPPTAKPPPAAPAAPTVSTMEFHVNPPTCTHAGQAYIKGTVYLNKNDPTSRYAGAIVVLGPPDGSTVYTFVKAEYDGVYSIILGDNGQAKPGYYGVWLADPSLKRKSDIGGPIVMNDLPESDPKSCWAGSVDFWK